MEARKSKTRLDYVSPKAFGVDVEAADLDYHRQDCELIEKTIAKYCSKYGRLTDELERLEASVDATMRQLAALAMRYDERLDMALGVTETNDDGQEESKLDAFQVEMVCRIFRQDEAEARQLYLKRELQAKTYINLEEESLNSSLITDKEQPLKVVLADDDEQEDAHSEEAGSPASGGPVVTPIESRAAAQAVLQRRDSFASLMKIVSDRASRKSR